MKKPQEIRIMEEAGRFGAMKEKERIIKIIVNGEAKAEEKISVLKDLFPDFKFPLRCKEN